MPQFEVKVRYNTLWCIQPIKTCFGTIQGYDPHFRLEWEFQHVRTVLTSRSACSALTEISRKIEHVEFFSEPCTQTHSTPTTTPRSTCRMYG